MDEKDVKYYMDKIDAWFYYAIIFIVSAMLLIFLPAIGSSADLGWNTPQTTVGWIIWIVVRIIVSGANVVIFSCFIAQGKVNIKDNAKFIEASKILDKVKNERAPISPETWYKRQYGFKAISIFFFSTMTTVAITQAILAYDWMSFATYLFTIGAGILFGFLEMKKTEMYFTDEYWRYAQMLKEKAENGESG